MEERQEVEQLEYAGFWVRFVAYLIDAIIWNGASFLTGWLFFGTLEASALWGILVALAYCAGFWTWYGQTPGKMIVGIKVVRTDGSAITLNKAVLRFLGYIISGIILYIGFIMIAFHGRKQGLHDRIADTYVVKISQVSKAPKTTD